jgi:hypothetical protein
MPTRSRRPRRQVIHDMNIRFKAKGIAEVTAFIKSIPRPLKIVAMRALVTYILGDSGRGLRHEPAYKYVTRKSAYGQTFQSEKQRRWFWANGGPDMIGNNRTGATSEGWQMSESSDWSRVDITNSAPGVGWTMGTGQAAQPAKVGWRKYTDVVKSNLAGGMRAANAAVNAWLKSRGRV